MVAATQATQRPEQVSLIDPLTKRLEYAGNLADTLVNRTYSLGMAAFIGAASLGTLGQVEWLNDKFEDYANDAKNYGDLGLGITGVISPGNAKAIVQGQTRAEEEAAAKVEEAKKKETEKAEAEKARDKKDDKLPTFSPLETIEKASGWISDAVGGVWNYGGSYADQGKLKRDVIADAEKFEGQLIEDLRPLVQGHKQVDGATSKMLKEVKSVAKAYREEAKKNAIRRFNQLADAAAGEADPIKHIEGKRAKLLEELKKDYIKAMRPAVDSYLHSIQRATLLSFFSYYCRKKDKEPTPLLRASWLDETKSLLQGFKRSKNTIQQDVNEVYDFHRKWDTNASKLGKKETPPNWNSLINEWSAKVDTIVGYNGQAVSGYFEDITSIFTADRHYDAAKGRIIAAATRLAGVEGDLKATFEEGRDNLEAWMQKIDQNKELPGVAGAHDKILGELGNKLIQSRDNETICYSETVKAIKELAETKSVIPEGEPDLLKPVYTTLGKISTAIMGHNATQATKEYLKTGVKLITDPFKPLLSYTVTQTAAKIFMWCVSADAIKDVKDLPGNTKLMIEEWGWGISRRTGQVLASSVFAFGTLCTAKILGSVVGGWIPGLDIVNMALPNDTNGMVWASLTLGAYYQLPKCRKYVWYAGAAAYGIQYYTPWGMPNPVSAAISAAGWGLSLTHTAVRFVWYMPATIKSTALYAILGSIAYQKAKKAYNATKKAVWDDTVIGTILPAYRWGNKAVKWVKKKVEA
ncbi:MAG: hypothetical protein Q8K75_05570 [Chlamydiales bacterium]|nr:hypothetical protein [Chlamydiales bacterium]